MNSVTVFGTFVTVSLIQRILNAPEMPSFIDLENGLLQLREQQSQGLRNWSQRVGKVIRQLFVI